MTAPINSRDIYLQASATRTVDTRLTPDEKPNYVSQYGRILNDQTRLNDLATKFNITTENTAYNTTVTALTTYLGTLTVPVAWNNVTNVTNIVRATFNTKFTDVDNAKRVLDLAIQAKQPVTGYLTAPALSIATDSAGVVPSYSTLTGTFKVFLGATDVTTGGSVTFSVVSNTNITLAINSSGVYTSSAMTADTATGVLRAVYAGITINLTFTVTKSKTGVNGTNGAAGSNGVNGQRGSRLFYVSGYTSWNSSDATTTASVDGGPILSDAVTQYGTGFSQMRSWNGSSWIVVTQVIDGNLLVTGTVSSGAFIASSFSGYLFTGAVFQTAASGKRITLNASGNNSMLIYNSGGSLIAEVGGGTTIASLYGIAIGSNWGVYGDATTGVGVLGGCTSGTGVWGQATSGVAGKFVSSSSGYAIQTDGRVTCIGYAESSHIDTETNNCVPITDNTYNLGTIARRWMGITSATALVVSSDIRTKFDIKDSDLGLDFLNTLRPVSYKLVQGKNEVDTVDSEIVEEGKLPDKITTVTPIQGKRTHYGLIAQEVKSALGNRDAAFWLQDNPTDPESLQALRYEELISPMIKAIQELSAQVKELKAKLK